MYGRVVRFDLRVLGAWHDRYLIYARCYDCGGALLGNKDAVVMKILRQENPDTRIVQKRGYLFSWVICRQRKVWYGWEKTSWLYTNQCKTLDQYATWFDWDERNKGYGLKQYL
jgi:hypothetical protein